MAGNFAMPASEWIGAKSQQDVHQNLWIVCKNPSLTRCAHSPLHDVLSFSWSAKLDLKQSHALLEDKLSAVSIFPLFVLAEFVLEEKCIRFLSPFCLPHHFFIQRNNFIWEALAAVMFWLMEVKVNFFCNALHVNFWASLCFPAQLWRFPLQSQWAQCCLLPWELQECSVAQIAAPSNFCMQTVLSSVDQNLHSFYHPSNQDLLGWISRVQVGCAQTHGWFAPSSA